MTADRKKAPSPAYDAEYVRDISEAVYRARMDKGDVERVEDDPDRGPAWLRRNAGAYDPLTRAYLDAANAVGLQTRKGGSDV